MKKKVSSFATGLSWDKHAAGSKALEREGVLHGLLAITAHVDTVTQGVYVDVPPKWHIQVDIAKQ